MRAAESTDIGDTLDIDALQAVLRQHPVQLAILFGSQATGTTHSRSDIDIAVEFDTQQPSDPGYNDVFLALSVDISDTLGTDDVDLVDLHALSPALAESIFENGILLIGNQEHAAELHRQITADDTERQSPRERFDSALARIDAYLSGSDAGSSHR